MPDPPRQTQTQTQLDNNEKTNPKPKPRQKQKQKHTINLPTNGIIALQSTNLLSRVASPPLGMNDAVVTFTDAHATYIMHISDYRRVESGFGHLEVVLRQFCQHDPFFDYSSSGGGGGANTSQEKSITAFTNRETLKECVVEQICKRRRQGSSLCSLLFSECTPVRWRSPLADADAEAEAEADTTTTNACEGPWLEIDSEGEEVCRGWQNNKRVQVQVQYVRHMSGNVVDAEVVDV